MGGTPGIRVDVSSNIVCDARGVMVNGESIDLYTGAAGEPTKDNCAGVRFANLLDPQMWSASGREFSLTVPSEPGLYFTSPGHGGAKVKFRGIDCTAYGAVNIETVEGGWRAQVAMECPGAEIRGEFVGLGF
jgi:hypothetical protein